LGEGRLALGDLERAIDARDPSLGELIVRYLAQDDPEPGAPELDDSDDEDDDDRPEIDVPAGAITLARLVTSVSLGELAAKTATEQKLARVEAFAAAEASRFAPPRLRVGKLLVALYERGEPADRGALLHAFARGKLAWGAWQAAKTIYKRAEELHDAALFGVLAYRFDAMASTPHADLGAGTLVYLRRRAWRYLRQLGRALPDAYATFASEALRHYPAGYDGASWVAAHVFDHGNMQAARTTWSFAHDDFAARAYPDAWKVSPAPLLHLIEIADNEVVLDFAQKLLLADHALALRAIEPAWLARLGRRGVETIDAFVVRLLEDAPELHQAKLRALGLHDVVVGFLRSPAKSARAYALAYCAAHAPDLPVGELVELLAVDDRAVQKFASARLEAMTPEQLGLPTLCGLLGVDAAPWAAQKLAQAFSPKQIDAATFIDTAARGDDAFGAIVELFEHARVPVPAAYYVQLLDDRRFGPAASRPDGGDDHEEIVEAAWRELGKRRAAEIGVAWIRASLDRRDRSERVARWLAAGMLAGPDLDVDWLKGLVRKPRLRALALQLLADRKLVAPARVGLLWVLDLARAADPDLVAFARRMLLDGFEPADLGGAVKIWQLATGKSESVRAAAASYLQAHHPELGPRLDEAKAIGVKPRLDHGDYALATVRPLLRDARADVRRLAVAIAGEEIVRWGDPDVAFELAGSPYPEPRALGGELLLGTIADAADARRVPIAWLDGDRLFRLAESPHKPSRGVALTLIRRLYERVGGAERLAWLMDSTDREVRLFAVRLFWDRHRPRPWPGGWTPRKSASAVVGTEPFADLAALRHFARVVVFGLPPGRVAPGDPIAAGAPRPERALAASVAKRRLIETMRDLALDDVELARAIAPLLHELSGSIAKGEWQASVQALAALRARHGKLEATA
jgi:hypothetical protein